MTNLANDLQLLQLVQGLQATVSVLIDDRNRLRTKVERLEAIHQDEIGTALALAPAYNQEKNAVKAFMSSQNIRPTSSRSSASVRSSSGYSAGQSAANSANLRSNGVGNSAARQIAG